jgi:hypothetical protein
MARATLEELQNDPRPLSASEAARILGLRPDQLAALNLPVVQEVDGEEVYDSADVIYWLRMQRSDPRQFARRIADYAGGPGRP